jgi:hypothetical protein
MLNQPSFTFRNVQLDGSAAVLSISKWRDVPPENLAVSLEIGGSKNEFSKSWTMIDTQQTIKSSSWFDI